MIQLFFFGNSELGDKRFPPAEGVKSRRHILKVLLKDYTQTADAIFKNTLNISLTSAGMIQSDLPGRTTVQTENSKIKRRNEVGE